METWEVYRCECNREFIINQIMGDEIEEPSCPECGESNSELLGEAEVNIIRA